MSPEKKLCRDEFYGYSVVIDRRADPAKLGPFFAAGTAVGHRSFFWKRPQAIAHKRDVAAHGFRARVVKVIVRMSELPRTHPWPNRRSR